MAEKTCSGELQQKLEQFIVETGGQEKAATLIGYSAGALSTYRAGKYKGNIETLEAKLKEFFATKEAAQAMYVSPVFVPTSISTQVYQTIRLCHLRGGFAIECGDAGIGKTKAAEKYIEDYPNSAVMVTANPCFSSITAFLKLLCRHLKLPIGMKDDMWLSVDSRLRGGRRVLIIDEAQHLTIKTIDSIRGFFDGNRELGIIMIGNAETVATRGGRNFESSAQIHNRTKLTLVRHTAQITHADIELLFPRLTPNGRETEFLLLVAQSEQGVRGAVNLYSNAEDNGNITYQGLLAVAKDTGVIVR